MGIRGGCRCRSCRPSTPDPSFLSGLHFPPPPPLPLSSPLPLLLTPPPLLPPLLLPSMLSLANSRVVGDSGGTMQGAPDVWDQLMPG